jgi:hypothetical protein
MRRIVLGTILAAAAVVPAVAAHWTPIGYAQTTTPLQGDEFNATSFNAPFVVQCAPKAATPCPDPTGPNTWSLDSAQPGYLRIQTLPGTLVGDDNNARNLVLQPVANATADYTVTTSLTFPGTGSPQAGAIGQTAGLLVYQDADHFIYLGRSFLSGNNGSPALEFRQEDGNTTLDNTITETSPHATIYLRLSKTGTLYQASYSYDNIVFTPIAPGPGPTATPTPTLAPTNTPTATNTPEPTTTGTPTATNTPAPTATPTNTATPLPTATQQPNGYVAAYPSPQVGLFAWGGTNSAASVNVIPADFDWFRVGANSQTPVVTATGTAVTATATSTATAVATATSTLTPPAPPATNTPTATATSTPAPTATNTPVPPTPKPTSKPTHPKPRFGFRYVSAWYHNVRIGDTQHLQAQAKIHSKQGIWVTITFASGKKIHIWTHTQNNGFWQAEVRIPAHTIAAASHPNSHRAWVTFQLWKGPLTTKMYKPFNVVQR